jgi:hypothetical protein
VATARGHTSRHSVFAQTYDDFSTVELYARRTWGSRPSMDPTMSDLFSKCVEYRIMASNTGRFNY